MPHFSVIIPTYNRADFIWRAVDSVLAQTCRDFEIIVIDDGSTDDTRAVLARYGEKIRYVFQTNRGVSNARNRGVAMASGAWLAFLDSDDEWLPDYLESQNQLILRYPPAVALLLNSEEMSSSLRIEKFDRHRLNPLLGRKEDMLVEDGFGTVILHHLALLHACVFRHSIIRTTRLFDEAISIDEDLDLMGQMALKGPLVLSRKLGARVFRRTETTKPLSAQFLASESSTRMSRAKLYDRFAASGGLTRRQRTLLARGQARNQRALGNVYLQERDLANARAAYRTAFALDHSPSSFFRLLSSYLPRFK